MSRPVAGRHAAALAKALLFACCCALTAALPQVAAADAVAGRQAFENGDYERAVTEWQSAADRGDAEAQFRLGLLYEQGVGDLKQDYKRADYWYRKAAEHDNSEAQYRLGLIWSAGGDDFPADLVEAYKWAVVAAKSKGVFGNAAADLKAQLDKVLTAREQQAGKDRARAWDEARTAEKTSPAPVAAAQAPASAPAAGAPPSTAPAAVASAPAVKPAAAKSSNGGCPGWPFPTLPCTEQFPALPGAQRAQAGPATAAAAPPPSAPTTTTPSGELAAILKKIDCASLNASESDVAVTVSGTVPSAEAREKIVQAVTRWFPDRRPAINVQVVPPPLCRVLTELDGMRDAGLLATGDLTLHLKDNGTRLQQGEPIELVVQAPGYPVHVRIDYFSLDGQVLHLAPGSDRLPSQLAARESRIFGRYENGEEWIAGGAPFGTELITVIATPSALNLGEARSHAEAATDYLRDLRRAFGRTTVGAKSENRYAPLLVHTTGR